jgi:tetratricopeptide (TPR) repeat protein
MADMVRQKRTLLILDGLEPLQYPPGPMGGRLKDQGLVSLLRELAYHNPGLCIITTRLPVEDLLEFSSEAADSEDAATVLSHDLNLLSPEAGSQLLERLGVQGLPGELEQAAREFQGNALALSLLGRFLARGYSGDIRRRYEIEILRETKYGGHAQRVMAAYAQWFAGRPELNILYLLGLFDRPALAGALEALKAPPPIPGLTSEVHDLSPADVQEALATLRDARLLAPADPDQPDTLDCHPLIREYFGGRLKEENPEAWRESHSRLYEYYKAQAPEFPETLEAMLPLYAAVAHGCKAGLHKKAHDLHWKRILREREFFSTRKLGAYATDLAALAGFFDPPWLHPVAGFGEGDKGPLMGQAAVRLQALGRLAEAVPPMKAALDNHIALESWENAYISAANLSDLSSTLGHLAQARDYALLAINLSGRSGDNFLIMVSRACLANVLLQQGHLIKAQKIFDQAEKIQQKRQSPHPFLFSYQGFQYCQLLLSLGRYKEVLMRAEETLKLARKAGNIRDIALDYLSLGQAILIQAQSEANSDYSQAKIFLDQAQMGLRQGGRDDDVVFALLSKGWLYRLEEDWNRAHRDLQEAMSRAKRSGMALLQTDAHLEYARLYLAQDQPEKARPHLATAKKMIAEIGYGRRRQDVLDLEAQLRRTR